MKNVKVLNYILIIIVIICISLALFYLYNSIILNESFITLSGNSNDINTIVGEPKINADKTINLILDSIRYNIDNSNKSLELLCSNNKGFYGIQNNTISSIYYYNTITTLFEKLDYSLALPTNSDGSRIINPDYKNRTPCAGALLNVSSKALWYYDNVLNDMDNVNIDGLYYTTIGVEGKPTLNNNNKIVLQCLRLPRLLTLPSPPTPEDAPYDTIKHIAVNDTILFAVGCYETSQIIYYCKLINGIPETNNATNWKTIQIGTVKVETIKNIFINNTYLFIISLNNGLYEIHYNKIEFNSNNVLISDFKKLSLLSSYSSPKFYFNNSILYIYDINLNNREINLKYINITDVSKQPLEVKKITFSNEDYTLPDNLMIYQNLLISINFNKYSILELYDGSITPNTSTNINKIRKMFNPNYVPTLTTITSTNASGNTTTTRPSGNTTTTMASGSNSNTTTTMASGSNSNTTTTRASGSNSNTTTTRPSGSNSNTTTTRASGSNSNTTTTRASGTLLPNPTGIPYGNQSQSSFVYGSALGSGSLLNSVIENIANNNEGTPINDVNFKELSGVNMLINGKENTGNFNDFLAKNRIFGNNLFFINKN